ncbi:MAG: diguanylate cyclase [Butyrivibrio sp.]|nr:diguanylate cyclase [Butyrivibrio sp.]
MYWQKINYYGFEKNRYNDCKELIHNTNYKYMRIINSWILFLSIVYMILCLLNKFGLSRKNYTIYYSFMIFSLIFEVVIFALKKICIKYTTVFVHISFFQLISFGICSSISQPYLAATIYLVLVVIVSVAYIDTMIRFTVLLIFYSSIFLYTSFNYKPNNLANIDMYNIMIFLLLSLIMHYNFQHSKINQFYTLQKNIQIQHDLEIRSSFDTLTDLLTKDRFFAIADQIIKDSVKLDEYIVVCLLDLDNFNEINNKLGHQIGDKAIQMASRIIIEELNIDMLEKWSFTERAVHNVSTFAGRLGGDECIMFIRGQKNVESITAILENILAKLNAVNIGELHGINASLGLASVSSEDPDIDSVYKRAGEALYRSKQHGKNCISVI